MQKCLECEQEFAPRHKGRKVCSNECYRARDIRRARETYARTREARLAKWRAKSLEERKQRPPVICDRCGSAFCYFGTGKIKQFCDPCARERQREMNRGRRFTKKPDTCKFDGCARLVNSRGMCAMHYRQWMKANGLWKPSPSDAWSDNRKAHHARRRALTRGAVGAVAFSRDDIFERDGHMCMLCWTPLDMEAKWPEPKSPTIDHIIPLAKGGSHTPENVQAACARCNVRKSDRTDWSLADVVRSA